MSTATLLLVNAVIQVVIVGCLFMVIVNLKRFLVVLRLMHERIKCLEEKL